jgi:transposase-like protein
MAIDFPVAELMDERACYDWLVARLHPDGLACPRCGRRDRLGVHRRHRDPVLDYQCGGCRRVFNAFTGTAVHKTRRRPSELVLVLRGVAQGETTARLARELGRDRGQLLAVRHRLQANAEAAADRSPLPDRVVEADEMCQNAGEKRRAARGGRRPAAAPRQQRPRARHVGAGPPARARRGRA